ncbi:MAG: 6-hydroxymethylpterin diphosphokinase MptE-like protein, partial [Thermoanaerobaculia bacterium]
MAVPVLERNLALVRKRWPELARRVEEAPPLPAGAVRAGKGGEPTLALVGEGGREVLLHSRYDPRAEAREQLARAEISPGDTVILLGLGLGYALEVLLQELRPGLVIACERDPAVLREALARAPFEGFLQRPETELVLGGDPAELFRALERQLGRIFGGAARVVAHPASARAFPSAYEGLSRSLREFTRHGAVVLRSALYLSRVSLENRFENLADYVASPGIRPLLGRFAGFPGVVVSAGPSLEKNADQLRLLQGRAVVIAVSTALKILLGRGIRPDFTAVIDYHALSARYFEGVPAEVAPPLVADLKASPAAVRAHAGAKLFGSDLLMDLIL